MNLEADVVDRRHRPGGGIEDGRQSADRQQRFILAACGFEVRAHRDEVSLYSPNTPRMLSAISPTVARACTAATIAGTRLTPSRAAFETASRAWRQSALLRLARTARTRSICRRSDSGSMVIVGIGAPLVSAENRLTPTTVAAPESTSSCAR